MKTGIVALLLASMFILAGCQYLKPAFAPSVDCSAGVLDNSTMTKTPTGAATIAPAAPKAAAVEKSRDGVPVKTVTEGDLVSFPNLRASDPDGDKLAYSFTSPLNKSGVWQTKLGDAGEYKVVITATDTKGAAVTQDVILKVLAGNHAPTIDMTDVSAKEGDKIALAPKVADPDGDKVTVAYSGWMTTNTKALGFTDAGTHQVTITADDGKGGKTSKTVSVNVADVNRAPAIAPMQDIAIKEGAKIELQPKATDIDGDKLTFTYTAPFDASGVWQTKKGDEGVKKASVTVDDGKGGKASTSFIIAIEALNAAPTISGPTQLAVKEGDSVNLGTSYTVSDADKDAVTVSYAGWMTTATKQVTYADQGTHDVTITADDKNNDPVKKTIQVVVADVNRPPTFDAGSFN
jgi:hypothetical protein